MRLCIFAHFDRNGMVDEYVWYYLKNLRKISNHIIFVSTSSLSEAYLLQLKEICDSVIVRENIGYDFVSWQTGLQSVCLDAFDEVILCNDSVYGPLFPLEDVFHLMSQRNCDYWGITDSHDIAHHLQSYFLVFKKSVLKSAVFEDFWKKVTIQPSKRKIIEMYEIGLSKALLKAGFKQETYVSCHHLTLTAMKMLAGSYLSRRGVAALLRKIMTGGGNAESPLGHRHMMSIVKRINVTHFLWKVLIKKRGMPFIKVELLRDNPLGINIDGYERTLARCSSYNVDLIRLHLDRLKRGAPIRGEGRTVSGRRREPKRTSLQTPG